MNSKEDIMNIESSLKELNVDVADANDTMTSDRVSEKTWIWKKSRRINKNAWMIS